MQYMTSCQDSYAYVMLCRYYNKLNYICSVNVICEKFRKFQMSASTVCGILAVKMIIMTTVIITNITQSYSVRINY